MIDKLLPIYLQMKGASLDGFYEESIEHDALVARQRISERALTTTPS